MLVAATLVPGASAAAATTSYMAGAGSADITPPPSGSAAAAAANSAFGPANCPAALFPALGRFALQEPFQDLNGDNQWDAGTDLSSGPNGQKPDPYCDANANGRWDGIYSDNGNGPARGVNDPIGVRAFAISDGHDKPVVYASVTVIGLFDYYTELARADLARLGVDADLVVSANHNESSPDTIGLYGALQTPLSVGVRSGIDEYYMGFLADRVAHAAAAAVRDLQPANLYANQIEGSIPDGTRGSSYPLLTGMSQRISDQFPTTVALPADDRVAAVDPKVGLLQARRPDGTPIFTVVSQGAHNQEMGNAVAGIGPQLSGDWPGAFQRSFDSSHAGTAIYLVGENGSIEDPQTDPAVVPNGSENHTTPATQYLQAQATGARLAAIADAAARDATELDRGTVRLVRRQFCIPLENNGFIALAAAGEFGLRQGYVCDQSGNPVAPVPNGAIAPTASADFRTFVAYADIGPDLQLLDNPGEAFPALMLGSPFGADEASCPRPNPAVPTWHARAPYRFQVGLADDMIGYLIPPWGFASDQAGLFNNDTCSSDQNGHRHKLESESTGPTAAGDVAENLAALLDAERDPSAHVATGRYLRADGSYSRWPTGAAGLLLAPAGQSALDPNAGLLLAAPATAGFGGRAADANAFFMDYDGQPQAAPDVTTRGMMVLDSGGCVAARYYLDVFPVLDSSRGSLGAARAQPAVLPDSGCSQLSAANGTPELQPGAALRAGLPVALGARSGRRDGHGTSPSRAVSACLARRRPISTVARRRLSARRHGRLELRGSARELACGSHRGRITRVTVAIGRPAGRRCRFVGSRGALLPARSCRRPILLLAHGTTRWSLRLALRLAPGRYRLVVRAVDGSGRTEAPGARASLRVR